MSIIFFIVIFLVFAVSPFVGLVMIAVEVIRSRQKTHDLKIILNGREYFERLITEKNIASSYAHLENWMENAIRELKTDSARTNLRLLMQVVYIGYNESVRELFFTDRGHRTTLIRQMTTLSNSYQDGHLCSSFYQMGLIYGLFLCDSKTIRKKTNIELLNLEIASDPLQMAAKLLDKNVYEADIYIGTKIKEIAQSGKPEEVGLALMLLHWAKYKIKEIDGIAQQHSWRFKEPTSVLSRQMFRLADACFDEDLNRVTDVICEKF